MTLRELNDVCKKVLAEGCIRLGLIENEEEDRHLLHARRIPSSWDRRARRQHAGK